MENKKNLLSTLNCANKSKTDCFHEVKLFIILTFWRGGVVNFRLIFLGNFDISSADLENFCEWQLWNGNSQHLNENCVLIHKIWQLVLIEMLMMALIFPLVTRQSDWNCILDSQTTFQYHELNLIISFESNTIC